MRGCVNTLYSPSRFEREREREREKRDRKREKERERERECVCERKSARKSESESESQRGARNFWTPEGLQGSVVRDSGAFGATWFRRIWGDLDAQGVDLDNEGLEHTLLPLPLRKALGGNLVKAPGKLLQALAGS